MRSGKNATMTVKVRGLLPKSPIREASMTQPNPTTQPKNDPFDSDDEQ